MPQPLVSASQDVRHVHLPLQSANVVVLPQSIQSLKMSLSIAQQIQIRSLEKSSKYEPFEQPTLKPPPWRCAILFYLHVKEPEDTFSKKSFFFENDPKLTSNITNFIILLKRHYSIPMSSSGRTIESGGQSHQRASTDRCLKIDPPL